MAKLPTPSFVSIIQIHHLRAMMLLGALPDPKTGNPSAPNASKARHELALLEILFEKTQGNLDENEEKMLRESIAALRLAIESLE